MPRPTTQMLTDIVRAHLQRAVDAQTTDLIKQFDTRITKGDHLAVDQLLNAIALLTAADGPGGDQAEELRTLLLQELARD